MAVATATPERTFDAAHPRPRRPNRFRRASAVGEWVKAYQSHLRHDALGLDLSAKLLQRELRNARGLDKAVAMIRARRATRQLYRAAHHADAAADCLGRFWKAFEEQYGDQMHGRPGKDKFEFN